MSKISERQSQAAIDRLIASLSAARKAQALSLNEVAARAGLSHTMVMRVEKGERMPTIFTLLRIAEALDVDLWKLLRDATKSVEN